MIKLRTTCIIWWSIGFAAILFRPVASWGEEDHQPPPTLTASAEGNVHLPPDKALVGLAVKTAGESLEEVQEENRKKMRQVLDRLQKVGIEEKHIQTSSLHVTPHYRTQRQGNELTVPVVPKIIGYAVNHSLTVEVHELDKIGHVVDVALKAGANRFSRITWALKNKRPAQL